MSATITVIIPCYNAEKYIERCLIALDKQTFKDFSVIFVDDCSQDDTVNILENYKMKAQYDVTVLKNDVNQGPGASRNKAIAFANSKYLAFCDSDDWYDDDYLELLFQSIKENESDVAFCGYKVISETGKIVYRYLDSSDKKVNKIEALKYDCDSLCMMIASASIFDRVQLPNLRNGEDMAVIPLIMVNSNNCSILAKCPYNYYRRKASSSEKRNIDVVNSLLKSFEYLTEHFPSDRYLELEFIGIKNVVYACLITLFSFSFDKKKAKSIITNFDLQFNGWANNPLIKTLPFYKRCFISLAKKRFFIGMRFVAIFRKILVRK